ncbi:asparagine synthase (glutamine-hydrolyzing) [Arenicella xantha]|uniref:asparagine synthase (glutamine-hydrolyzing) n=1 Tax=Arenicella xantha TaxID=644221 RepID=A0A395JP17_9GAMM|nr:asparagine synthase (glutamine-hydrolyzing) [Arenicella xantha]RBP51527.1 asparagine synthase (glutamine-hydrolysing) [Arenicella xantha]
MCGIAGLLSTDAKQDMAAPLAAMQNALTHRGPDGRGEYLSPSRQAGLTHTRLAIIDLTASGGQPMTSSDGRYTITFNGEIYNYQQLRKRLEASGESFATNSDTEVILKMYASKGSKCVHFLRGMFAFLIWDEKNKTAFAARDPLGIKPFYYLRSKGEFAFGSELRSVLASGLSNRRLSSTGLTSYFLRGTPQEPNTLIRDIKLLPAGSHLTWRKGRVSLKTYWKVKFKPQYVNRKQATEMTRVALQDSIRAHFVSDVPVGIFLSGGIDSSALVALATKVSKKPINTYSLVFDSPEWNEGDVAKRTAEHFGTNHTELLMTPMVAMPLFQQYLDAVDQPTIDGFNTFCVAKLAREHGEKVVLSGLGADELFAGYKSFDLIPEMLAQSARLAPFTPLLKFLSKPLQTVLPTKYRRMLDALLNPKSVAAAHLALRGIFSSSESVALTKQYTGTTATLPKLSSAKCEDLADDISALELNVYMRNQLLRDSDMASMAWGLELRVPFVDKVLIDRISTIPADLRLLQGKRLLIDAVPELPNWVIDRPKQGFRFPFDEWFSDEWEDLAPTKTPMWIPLKPWYRKWSLVVLNEWIQRHVKTS